MKVRVRTYHPTELQPDSDMRVVLSERTFDVGIGGDYEFRGDDLRILVMRTRGDDHERTVALRENDCWVYVMNDDGSNFDKRYFKAEAPEVLAARRAPEPKAAAA